jgi:hypothetical protein
MDLVPPAPHLRSSWWWSSCGTMVGDPRVAVRIFLGGGAEGVAKREWKEGACAQCRLLLLGHGDYGRKEVRKVVERGEKAVEGRLLDEEEVREVREVWEVWEGRGRGEAPGEDGPTEKGRVRRRKGKIRQEDEPVKEETVPAEMRGPGPSSRGRGGLDGDGRRDNPAAGTNP